jgi:uncharacterized protein (DUF1778 family)
MPHVTERPEKARFDGQLSAEQKSHFEYAAALAGNRTLTEFVFTAAQEKADRIISEHQTLLHSQRDRDVFFEALMNPPAPNKKLKAAAKRYKETASANALHH